MGRAALLLLGSRSRLHRWLLFVARAASAVVVGGAAALAAAHGHHHLALWRAALIAIIAVAVLAVIASAGAYVTEPVSETHHASLRASAASLLNGLTSMFCEYGGSYEPEQAFRSHFGWLSRRLRTWDAVRVDAGEQQRVLGEHVDSRLEEHSVVGSAYAVGHIRTLAMEVGLRRAGSGGAPLPDFDWARNWGTTAVEPGVPAIRGPAEGWLAPFDGAPRCVILPPSAGETQAEWRVRARTHTDRIDGLMKAVREGSLDPSRAVVAAREKVAAFRVEKLPVVREALELIEIREPPRHRWRCKSC
jgi:hypothetical protein